MKRIIQSNVNKPIESINDPWYVYQIPGTSLISNSLLPLAPYDMRGEWNDWLHWLENCRTYGGREEYITPLQEQFQRLRECVPFKHIHTGHGASGEYGPSSHVYHLYGLFKYEIDVSYDFQKVNGVRAIIFNANGRCPSYQNIVSTNAHRTISWSSHNHKDNAYYVQGAWLDDIKTLVKEMSTMKYVDVLEGYCDPYAN